MITSEKTERLQAAWRCRDCDTVVEFCSEHAQLTGHRRFHNPRVVDERGMTDEVPVFFGGLTNLRQ